MWASRSIVLLCFCDPSTQEFCPFEPSRVWLGPARPVHLGCVFPPHPWTLYQASEPGQGRRCGEDAPSQTFPDILGGMQREGGVQGGNTSPPWDGQHLRCWRWCPESSEAIYHFWIIFRCDGLKSRRDFSCRKGCHS